jgi:cytidyltransferase-like protein
VESGWAGFSREGGAPTAFLGRRCSQLRRGVQQNGGTVVFTNGVFDLLHPGHIRYLQQARALGDTLIVAVNSDRSVRALGKAPTVRSIQSRSVPKSCSRSDAWTRP